MNSKCINKVGSRLAFFEAQGMDSGIKHQQAINKSNNYKFERNRCKMSKLFLYYLTSFRKKLSNFKSSLKRSLIIT